MEGKVTTVAYKLKRGRKVKVEVFPYHVDRINNSRSTKPIIPHDAEILAMGVGEGFYDKYCKKYQK